MKSADKGDFKVKIAFVIHDINKEGGQERYCAELIERLSKSHEVHIFAVTMCDMETGGSVSFHKVPVISSITLLKSFLFFIISSWMLKRYSFDIIHGNGGNCLGANIITTHYCHKGWGTAVRLFLKDAACCLKKVYRSIVMKMDIIMEEYIYSSKKCKLIIANSIKTKKELMEYYSISDELIRVIYLGVDTELFNPSNRDVYRVDIRNAFKIPDDACLLLFVGAMERKGLFYLLQSLRLLKEVNVFLIIAGKGDEGYFRREAKMLGVEGMIRFAGQRNDIYKYYASADVFIMPTLYEPFGMAVTEAMASGLPVVTSRQAGVSELITEGEDGILLDNPADPEEIAHRIIPLILDKDLRLKIGQKARKKAESMSWDKMAVETVNLYEEIKRKLYSP